MGWARAQIRFDSLSPLSFFLFASVFKNFNSIDIKLKIKWHSFQLYSCVLESADYNLRINEHIFRFLSGVCCLGGSRKIGEVEWDTGNRQFINLSINTQFFYNLNLNIWCALTFFSIS